MDGDVLATFLAEAEERVIELEQGLVALESDPGDAEVVHRIFRSAHTLKGNAGMLGFDAMVSLAHLAESILARVRGRELAIDKDLTSLLLAAADSFRAMLEEVGDTGGKITLGPSHQKLLSALQVYLPPPGATAAKAPAAQADKTPSGPRVYEIDLRFEPRLFRTGQDPSLLLRDLAELGEISRVTGSLEDMPPFESMEPESCYLHWNLLLTTERPRDDIDGVFIFLGPANQIRVSDVTGGVGRQLSLAPAEKKIGELLIEGGLVREKDIADALQGQKRLGEVLVDLGKVKKESLERVLAKQTAARQTRRASTIRVDTDKLDKLVNLVGEMVITVAQVNQTTRDPGASEAVRVASVEALDQICRELQSQVMSVRMVPVEETFNRFQRAIRDLAQELGKHVVLEAEGTETELDKIVIEQLADPLKHMVRNAVAHGIESPEERIKAGKSDTGRIRLRAAQKQGKVIIEVADDGRGIDSDAVLKKARGLGLVAPDAKLSERQIFDFIFQPGFSTAKQVDEISGRGVGMDVVYRNVSSLRGTIDIESVLGRGTTFRIQLPLTLAIIEGMHVQAGERTLTIPLLSVVELITARPEGIHSVEGKGELIDVRGEYLPMVRLSSLLYTAGEQAYTPDSVVVVLENERRKFGIMVDRVLGMEQTVVKPLEKAFSLMTAIDDEYAKPAGIAGATILGDGNVALIVDVAGLERMAFDEAVS